MRTLINSPIINVIPNNIRHYIIICNDLQLSHLFNCYVVAKKYMKLNYLWRQWNIQTKTFRGAFEKKSKKVNKLSLICSSLGY